MARISHRDVRLLAPAWRFAARCLAKTPKAHFGIPPYLPDRPRRLGRGQARKPPRPCRCHHRRETREQENCGHGAPRKKQLIKEGLSTQLCQALNSLSWLTCPQSAFYRGLPSTAAPRRAAPAKLLLKLARGGGAGSVEPTPTPRAAARLAAPSRDHGWAAAAPAPPSMNRSQPPTRHACNARPAAPAPITRSRPRPATMHEIHK